MSASRATAVLEHARKLRDGSDPQGRASMLAGMVAMTAGAGGAHLDDVARVLLREQPMFREAVERGGEAVDPSMRGIGILLVVKAATHPDLETRLRLCNVYAEAFAMARWLRGSSTLAGIGRMAAKRLAERVDGNVSTVLGALGGMPDASPRRPPHLAIAA